MTIPKQFTTIPNDYPAPTWENPGLYWNPDYLAYCERRDRGSHHRVQHGAVRVEQTPVSNTIVPGKAKYAPVRAMRCCAICDTKFVPLVASQKLCGSAACKLERDRQKARAAYVPAAVTTRVCVECGTQYRPVSGSQRTCGPACRDAWNKRKKAISNRDYRERRKGRAA